MYLVLLPIHSHSINPTFHLSYGAYRRGRDLVLRGGRLVLVSWSTSSEISLHVEQSGLTPQIGRGRTGGSSYIIGFVMFLKWFKTDSVTKVMKFLKVNL